MVTTSSMMYNLSSHFPYAILLPGRAPRYHGGMTALRAAAVLSALLAALPVFLAPAASARQDPAPPALPRGEIVETVAAKAAGSDPAQTYALYLPSGYRPDRRWPILYVMDARGRARLPLERFRAAAESLGWVVASSYRSSSDGDTEPNFAAMRAMWADTHARLSLDDRRAYAAGFSGTVRAACALAMMAPGTLDGVIGVGAGFPAGHPPTRDTPFPFFGMAGDADFNFYEMANLEEALAGAGLPHRVEFFPGGHEWMPEPLAFEALAWMDLQAMKTGAREPAPLVPGKKDFGRAALALSIAAGIAPDDPDVWYALAVAQALGGGRKRALSALEKAGEAGFKDAKRLEAEEAFAPLREEAGFRRLVAGLGGGSRPGGARQ